MTAVRPQLLPHPQLDHGLLLHCMPRDDVMGGGYNTAPINQLQRVVCHCMHACAACRPVMMVTEHNTAEPSHCTEARGVARYVPVSASATWSSSAALRTRCPTAMHACTWFPYAASAHTVAYAAHHHITRTYQCQRQRDAPIVMVWGLNFACLAAMPLYVWPSTASRRCSRAALFNPCTCAPANFYGL